MGSGGRAGCEDGRGEGRDRTACCRVSGDGDDGGGSGAVHGDLRGLHDLGRSTGRGSVPPESGHTDWEGVACLRWGFSGCYREHSSNETNLSAAELDGGRDRLRVPSTAASVVP